MSASGDPIRLESFGSGSVFWLPLAVPVAGFLAGGFDALLYGRDLGLTIWR